MKATLVFAAFVTSIFLAANSAQGQQPSPQERIANLKGWLQASQAQIRAYE